jgi:hypothetical protein
VTDGGTLRVTWATDDAAAVDLSDISGNTANAASDLAYIRANLSIDAVSDQAALTQGPQVMALASAATPTAMSADGDAVRIWADLYGRLHAVWEGIEDAAETAGGYLSMAGTVRRDTAASSAGTAGDNATLNTDGLGRVWVRDGGPCADPARITTAAVDSAASGNVEVVALNGSDIVYVCGFSLVASAATSVQFIYGTGTACATGETDLSGPMAFAANGGITNANAGAVQMKTPAGNAFCIENSGANQVSGFVSYVRTAAP